MIKFRCEQCGQKIGVPEKLIGRHIKCPRCKNRQIVQAEGAEPAGPPSLVETAKLEASLPDPEFPPEPERILRGQTLDLDDKPADSPAEEEEAPPAPKPAQASLLALAGIDAKTARSIGTKEPEKRNTASGARELAGGEEVIAYKDANWPGMAAGFIAVVAGCLIAVGAPSIVTLTFAGAAVILSLVGLLISMTSKRWEQWSAIVGVAFSVVALGAACAVGAFRKAAPTTAVNPGPVVIAAHTAAAETPAPVLDAMVPDRARVTVNAVRIGPPELRPDASHSDRTPRLLIYLTITNLSDRPFNYLSWGPGGRIATLSSLNGVQLTPIMFPKGALLNHPQQTTISPHGQELDVLVFAPMYPMPRLLALDLPCGNIGTIGSMHLLMPSSVGEEKK